MKYFTLKLAAIGLMLVITNQSAIAAEPGVVRIKDDSVKPAASRIVKKLCKQRSEGCCTDGCGSSSCGSTGCGSSCTSSSPNLCYNCKENGRPHCSHRQYGVCKGCEKQLRADYRMSQKLTRQATRELRYNCRENQIGGCPRDCRECRGSGVGPFKYRLANCLDRIGTRLAGKYGYFIPTGGDGRGLPPFGHYRGVYAVNPAHAHPTDGGGLYATEVYNVPVSIPLAPNVHKQWNYSWGTPSSRITPISNYRGY